MSRATLSRLENAEVSPTTNVLGKLCAAYGLTMTRLMHMVEGDFVPLVRQSTQSVWTDPTVGFRRRLELSQWDEKANKEELCIP